MATINPQSGLSRAASTILLTVATTLILACGAVLYRIDKVADTLLLRMDYAVATQSSHQQQLSDHDKRLRDLEVREFRRSGHEARR